VGGDRGLAGELGLPTEEAPLAEAIDRAVAAAPCAPLEPALSAARRWAELRHVADLTTLARRPGVVLAHDPVSDASFVLLASRCGDDVGYAAVGLRDGELGSRTLALAPGERPEPHVVEDVRWGRYTAMIAPPRRAP
jgi:hypothetical protein